MQRGACAVWVCAYTCACVWKSEVSRVQMLITFLFETGTLSLVVWNVTQ